LFIIISLLETRLKTREISKMGGIATQAPRIAVIFMIIILGSIGLPLTNGFIGEFLLLFGIFEINGWAAAIAGLTIIFGAVYMLWMYQRSMLGKPNEVTRKFHDINFAEAIPLIPIVIMIIWIGIFPNFFLHIAEPAIQEILNLIH
jgi:NADH-quinone oxidoreductase subunit M